MIMMIKPKELLKVALITKSTPKLTKQLSKIINILSLTIMNRRATMIPMLIQILLARILKPVVVLMSTMLILPRNQE
jgi:hypothetical protein